MLMSKVIEKQVQPVKTSERGIRETIKRKAYISAILSIQSPRYPLPNSVLSNPSNLREKNWFERIRGFQSFVQEPSNSLKSVSKQKCTTLQKHKREKQKCKKKKQFQNWDLEQQKIEKTKVGGEVQRSTQKQLIQSQLAQEDNTVPQIVRDPQGL